MPPALQFVYAVLFLIAEGSGLRMLMAAPNRELELEKSKLFDRELVVPGPGTHNCELPEQLEAAHTLPTKCSVREESTGTDAVSPHSREKKMAASDAEIGKCG